MKYELSVYTALMLCTVAACGRRSGIGDLARGDGGAALGKHSGFDEQGARDAGAPADELPKTDPDDLTTTGTASPLGADPSGTTNASEGTPGQANGTRTEPQTPSAIDDPPTSSSTAGGPAGSSTSEAASPPATAATPTQQPAPTTSVDAADAGPTVDPEPDPETCDPVACSADECGVSVDECGQTRDCGPCPSNTCGESISVTKGASTSRGMGFTGTDDDYFSLYDAPCDTVADCEVACAAVGGDEAMCAASECTDNFDDTKDCLPATAWRNVAGAAQQSDDIYSAAVLTVVYQDYEDFLAVEGFGLEVPSDAIIDGIEVAFLRAAGSAGDVTDYEIRLLEAGERSSDARAVGGDWGTELSWVEYGGPTDLWGRTWTPAMVNDPQFGAAISADYLQTAGNARAYVDHAQITVHYHHACSAE